jgi:transposase
MEISPRNYPSTESPWKSWRLLTLETRMESCRRNSRRESRLHAGTARMRRPPRYGWSGRCARSWAPGHGTVQRVAGQLGYGIESVRSWVRQADIDDGYAPGVSTSESQRVKDLEQEIRELKRANEILKRAASFFGAELDRQYKK